MAFDLEEQEQIDKLKAFWERWGFLVSTVVTVSALTFIGWRGYEYYQIKQSEKAAEVYEVFNQAVQKKDASLDGALSTIQQSYGKTQYAAAASLQAAQVAIAAEQWDKAQAPLQWLVANGSLENQGAARLLLADVLAQTGKNEDALKVLDTVPSEMFALAFANKKADVYLQMKDMTKAREALEAALQLAKQQGATSKDLVDALQAKLDLLPKS
ncbi:YfgM family protein [Hydromonas duriensis]|uniref:Ancillary SecYEG translocon subunit n=1 Tax=Hydromonas duriensis TaxID=1527608 RepID=A0A4R6Y808_9BURK|nr:tetratricopeptide repeat protein [Hydromonas duriensis]TDR31506.1 putative negative regulator of RcsB-dependent stress response [Hydromonas duriensis]